MSHKSYLLSDIVFDFNTDSPLNLKKLHIRQVNPDYLFKIKRRTVENELFKRFKILYLNNIHNPWLFFGFYFTPNKIEELDRGLISYLDKNNYNQEKSFDNTWDQLIKKSGKKFFENFEFKVKQENIMKNIFTSRYYRKFINLIQIYILKIERNSTLKEISKKMKIDINEVSYLWNLLKNSHGEVLSKTFEKIRTEKLLIEFFPSKIKDFMSENSNKTKSVFRLYSDFAKKNGNLPIRNESHFSSLLKDNGFTYKSFIIRTDYSSKHSKESIDFVEYLQFEFLSNEKTFEVFWVDESTVCPQNFQKKGWGLKGRLLTIASDLKYDKLKIFGILSKKGIFALRFLKGNNSQMIFDDFLIESIKNIIHQIDEDKIPVIFLDNSPLHKSERLITFCRKNKILLVFNIAYNPQGNPIELLWRFLKIPLKSISSSNM